MGKYRRQVVPLQYGPTILQPWESCRDYSSGVVRWRCVNRNMGDFCVGRQIGVPC